MDNKPKQIEAKVIGDKGCYFLSIIDGVCRYLEIKGKAISVDIIQLYEIAMEAKWLSNDCYVERPDLIAAYLLGVSPDLLNEACAAGREIPEVRVTKRNLEYMPSSNEIEITRYEKEATGITFSHFVETRKGEVVYDPYGNSNTVSKGQPVSKRIITVNM